MYIRDPRGAIRSYAYDDAMGDDLPVCSQSTPVGAKCVQPDDAGTSTADWLKKMVGWSSSSSTPTPATPAGPSALLPPATTPAPSPGFFDSLTAGLAKAFGPQQPASPVVAPSGGTDTTTILMVGAVGVAAIYLLTRKKKA